jgi:hypothetical protein
MCFVVCLLHAISSSRLPMLLLIHGIACVEIVI